VRQARDQVRAGRDDQDLLRPARQFDMPHRRFGRLVPQSGSDRLPGQRLKRQGRHEARRVFGQHDAHLGAGIAQPARQLGCLVGGDAAGDAKQHAQIGQRQLTHVGIPPTDECGDSLPEFAPFPAAASAAATSECGHEHPGLARRRTAA